MTDEISEKYLLFHYQDLVLFNEELVKLSYSIGFSKEEIFPYYQGILSHLKVIASEGVSFDLAVNIFALGVLYSERKEEFLDDSDLVALRRPGGVGGVAGDADGTAIEAQDAAGVECPGVVQVASEPDVHGAHVLRLPGSDRIGEGYLAMGIRNHTRRRRRGRKHRLRPPQRAAARRRKQTDTQ